MQLVIQTPRCIIRNFMPADIASFMAYRNNLTWMRYQGFKGLSQTEYEAALFRDLDLEVGVQLAIIRQLDGQLLGDLYVQKEQDNYWIGYTIHPAHARQGYAQEAAATMIEWLSSQGSKVIKAGVMPENTASIKLLENLGFHYLETEAGEWIYMYKSQ